MIMRSIVHTCFMSQILVTQDKCDTVFDYWYYVCCKRRWALLISYISGNDYLNDITSQRQYLLRRHGVLYGRKHICSLLQLPRWRGNREIQADTWCQNINIIETYIN